VLALAERLRANQGALNDFSASLPGNVAQPKWARKLACNTAIRAERTKTLKVRNKQGASTPDDHIE
jgi:hypothetical protein